MIQTALLGIHEPEQLGTITDILLEEGYVVEQASSLQEILRCAREGHYTLVVVDLNFGSPGNEDSAIGIQVYRQVQKDVEAGVTRFVGFSGCPEAVEFARRQGTPVYGKPIDLSVILGR